MRVCFSHALHLGARCSPRPGSEVLVDFIDGDIDRPIIVGQLHNGPHELPWPAGVDAGVNHPGTIAGWHHPHLDADGGSGANQWVIDDATGQLRMRLASHSASTGHSELTLGHLVQQSAGSIQHSIRLINGGQVNFAFNQAGQVVELSGARALLYLTTAHSLSIRSLPNRGRS